MKLSSDSALSLTGPPPQTVSPLSGSCPLLCPQHQEAATLPPQGTQVSKLYAQPVLDFNTQKGKEPG